MKTRQQHRFVDELTTGGGGTTVGTPKSTIKQPQLNSSFHDTAAVVSSSPAESFVIKIKKSDS
jgi:hypothetical protein